VSHSNGYIIGFAASVCFVCAIFVAGSAVALKERQEVNKLLDKQKNVLSVSGHMPDDTSGDSVRATYAQYIRPKVVDLQTGQYVEGVEPSTFDQREARDTPELSRAAPAGNAAKVLRLPNHGLMYQVTSGDTVESIILPIEGKGLWSTLYGFLALAPDGSTIKGLTFYEHAETPGLGGEVDNPRWKSLWVGRKAFNDQGKVAIKVIKGSAGPVESDPHHVDGLSGATLTARGVSASLEFWLGENGWGPYLNRIRAGGV